MPEEDQVNLELLGLSSTTVKLENILVDPNNPRLLEMGFEQVPEERIAEERVQKETITNMKNVGLKDIIEKVKKVGFLTVDRVVVRPLNEDKFVVLEGNRRISSLKTLKEDHERGRVSLNETMLRSIEKFEVLVYSGKDTNIVWLIQGLRHLQGIKNWGPIQQAKFLVEMQERRGLSLAALASMTGLGRTNIAHLIRSYKGWEQAKENDDYGDKIDASKFSLFQEGIFARPILREWLGWDDGAKKFKNQENLNKLLAWYLGDEEVNNGEPRLPRVNPDVRDVLSKLLLDENKSILQEFENGDISIDKARFKVEEREIQKSVAGSKVDLESQLADLDQMATKLETLPIPKILEEHNKIDTFIDKLEKLENAAKSQRKTITTMRPKQTDEDSG